MNDPRHAIKFEAKQHKQPLYKQVLDYRSSRIYYEPQKEISLMLSSERFNLPANGLEADTNIRTHYPVNKGAWIVHPEITAKENSFCRYTLNFTLEEDATVELHVSADNRFELRCNGNYIGMGPDRSDIYHWSFHSYRLELEKGAHTLDAEVHFLHKSYPYAQTAIQPAFVLYSEDSPVDINTGSAPWKAVRLKGVGTDNVELRTFAVVGPNYTIDAESFFSEPQPVEPKVLQKAGRKFGGGSMLRGWRLYPSRLPEQTRTPVNCGKVRVVADFGRDDPIPDENGADFPEWQEFVAGKKPLEVPAETEVTAIWDLDNYYTAYPELTTTGGAGSSIQIEWAESCYKQLLVEGDREKNHIKGNRNEVTGKFFRGLGDIFKPDGEKRTFRPFWWRAGRYVRIRIKTAEKPLMLEKIRLLETRMPLEDESRFTSSDPAMDPIINVSVRGIQMCAHETYMDCPYYEQMMYVGDTRIQVLTSYVMNCEDRLNQRALELFDWSRRETGFVLERHPSRPTQLSCTFAMIWILMLRDYGWWRDDADFMKKRLKGMRCLLEEFKALQGGKDLMPALPGWSFMDWVKGLSSVNNPGPGESVSSVINLLFINTLKAAAEIEEAYGEEHLAAYNRDRAERLAVNVDKTFWDHNRALFAENPVKDFYSEHSQCLALLSGLFPAREKACLESLLTADDLARTTVYFSYYLLEVLAKFGRSKELLEKFDFWKDMVAMGFKTPVETPEPSRSDCHAWGSHPLFHMHASLAGIRPASAGFKTVRISPNPGPLTELESELPHPAGKINFSMHNEGESWKAKISLPDGIKGTLAWQDKEYSIEGDMELSL